MKPTKKTHLNLSLPMMIHPNNPKSNRTPLLQTNGLGNHSIGLLIVLSLLENDAYLRNQSTYVKSIERGEGTADNRPSKPDLPAGIQIPPSTCEIKEIEGELPVPEAVESTMAAAVSDTEALEPKTISKAKKHLDWPKWKAVIQAELDALTKMKTWQVVERPKGRNFVQCKWVFKIKKDAEGKIERYKAHLVAKGFTQVENVNYYETWAPVTKLASIRTPLL